MPARLAGACGLLAFVTAMVGWVAGGFRAAGRLQRGAGRHLRPRSRHGGEPRRLYDRLGANLTGLLVLVCALGLWRSVGPSLLGRLGAGVLAVAGAGGFLDGLFRLDCRGIDAACTNHTWHSHAHKIESGFTGAALLLAPVLCAYVAFRKLPHWHGAWLPSLLTLPAILLANIVFSTIGDGAATRAGSVVAFAWIAFVGARLLAAPAEEVPTADPARPATL